MTYSIFDRTIEEDGVKAYCKEAGIGIIAFSPLAQGMLTDKYLHGIPQDSRIAKDARFLHAADLTQNRAYVLTLILYKMIGNRVAAYDLPAAFFFGNFTQNTYSSQGNSKYF